MRVITGTARGAKLYTLDNEHIRPTIERIKEAEFSAIQFYVQGAKVLDIFAGTGQMGIEALSRGASEAVFVDNDDEAIKLIRRNLTKTKLQDKARVVKNDAFRYLASLRREFDIVFCDAPYRLGIPARILSVISEHISESGFVLFETELSVTLPEMVDELSLNKTYRYGKTMIWMYRKKLSEDME
ncbi:MAG: 16S rRNA (guanine(966)-N(2))-methyltransferase RsmD [Oscillospiraceae bacterium]|nr:16S rRNA (guanine(966)-N(2))-methyltransferase RsmD [Oscillospiraceae bacterium]